MKRCVFSIVLALTMLWGLGLPAAGGQESAEILVDWLPDQKSLSLEECYNPDLNWLTLFRDFSQEYTEQGINQNSARFYMIDLATGERVEAYDCVYPFNKQELALALKYDGDGKLKRGFINRAGETVIPLEYDSAGAFREGLAPVMKYDSKGNARWGFINQAGEAVVPLEYDDVELFPDGEEMAPVMKYDGEGNARWGYVNRAGEMVVSPEYDEVEAFADGLAKVCKIDRMEIRRYGMVDAAGREVLPVEYDNIARLSDGLIFVRKDIRVGSFQNPYWKDEEAEPEGPAGQKGGAVLIPVLALLAGAACGAAAAVLAGKKRASAVPEQAPAKTPKFCLHCGKPLVPGMKFCPGCGTRQPGGESDF